MGLMDKVRVAIFGEFDEDDDLDVLYEDEVDERPILREAKKSDGRFSDLPPLRPVERKPSSPGGKVVNFNTNAQMEFFVTSPDSFDEAIEICDNIRNSCPVVVNLEKVEPATAQRLLDFISGACYALDGSLQRVSNNIFLLAPNNVAISSDIKEELRTGGGYIKPLGKSV